MRNRRASETLARASRPSQARSCGESPSIVSGPAGRLASSNATRNTTRTATTAGALMSALALVTRGATLAASSRASFRSADEDAVSADYVVTSKSGYDTIPTTVGTAVARADGVRSVSAVRHDEAKAFGKKVSVDGIAPNLAETVNLRWDQGSDAVIPRLGAAGAIVTKQLADDRGLRIGSPVTVTTNVIVRPLLSRA